MSEGSYMADSPRPTGPPEPAPSGVDLDWLAISGAAVLLMLPSLLGGLPTGHSQHFNLIWHSGFMAELADGVLYPRWIGGLWTGAGGADFYFYAPLPFWLAGVIGLGPCSGCSGETVLVLTGVVLLALSGVSFRVLARRLAGRIPALIGAVVYMALPYHLGVEWHDRQALGEFAAIAVLPAHLASVLACLEGRERGGRLALLTAVLALSHMPSGIIAAAGYVPVVLALHRPFHLRPLGRVLLAGLAGLGLAGMYWYPAVQLLDSVNSAYLTSAFFDWRNWMFTSGIVGMNIPFFNALWPPLIVLSALTIGFHVLCPGVSGTGRLLSVSLIGMTWLMVTPLSYPLWSATPLSVIQFPYRFLVLADLGIAVGAALAASALLGAGPAGWRRGAAALALGGITLAAALDYSALRAHRGAPTSNTEATSLRIGAPEWLPAEVTPQMDLWASAESFALVQAITDQPLIAVPDGNGRAEIIKARSRSLVFDIDLSQPSRIVIRRTWWQHWRLVEAGSGRAVALAPTPAGPFPLITAELPAGKGRYRLELPVLAAEWAGYAISLAALLALVLVHGGGLWSQNVVSRRDAR
ncbi:MAG: hypothetical protein ACTSVG_04090 [Alphaproteobacteria bacterium]